MKTLLTGVLFVTALLSGTYLSERNQNEMELQILADDVFKDKVKVFDYEGNLLSEMKADDVADQEISIADYLILESSDFAFKYLGDYYYLRD